MSYILDTENRFSFTSKFWSVQFSSVQSLSVSDSLWPHGRQHSRPPCPSVTPWVYSNSCPLSWWCHPTTSSSVIPFSSCLQSFPALGSFQMSQFFALGGQSIGVSASTLVLPDEYSGLIFFRMDWLDLLAVQGLSRVFSSITFKSINSPSIGDGKTIGGTCILSSTVHACEKWRLIYTCCPRGAPRQDMLPRETCKEHNSREGWIPAM